MSVPTEKSTFDNACSKTPWYLPVSALIEKSSFISALNALLKICRVSVAGTEISTTLEPAWIWEVRTK